MSLALALSKFTMRTCDFFLVWQPNWWVRCFMNCVFEVLFLSAMEVSFLPGQLLGNYCLFLKKTIIIFSSNGETVVQPKFN